jgi:hypothetical protein
MTDNGEVESEVVIDGIMDGVELVVEGRPGGKAKLTAYYTGGETRETLYSNEHEAEFYTKHTDRGEIRKNVAEALEDTPLDADMWETAWKGWVTNALESEDEAAVEVVHESVRSLAEGTTAVRNGKAGDQRIWEIDIEWNDDSGTLRFDAGDMANGGVSSLKTQMFTEFGNCPQGIENEEWDSLKRYWLDIQTEAYEETVTERDRAKEMFLNKLKERVTGYDSAPALARDKASVWVDEGNSYDIDINGLAGDVEAVAWVRSDLVNTVVDEMDNAPRIGELATELQNSHDVLAGSKRRKPDSDIDSQRYWFFDPDSLGIKTVHEYDGDDKTGEVDV